jgi:hypothetical protein
MGDQVRHCILLAHLVNVYALSMTGTQGNEPTAQTLGVVADRFLTLEAWAQFDREEVLNYVYSISNVASTRSPLTGDATTRIAFVMGAHLLSAYASEPWYERLDTILDRVEAARG